MHAYLDLLRRIRNEGTRKDDRTGTGTLSLFGHQMRFNLQEGFPLVTTKKVFFKGIVYELLWFLRGETNIRYLRENDIHIWDEWADADGELGPVYGKQWRAWPAKGGGEIDQISRILDQIREHPDSRRHIVSAWNVGELGEMALPPCHLLFQFYVADGKLSCQLYQRSVDVFLGLVFNIASYALLTRMIAQQTDLEPGDFIFTGGDCHLYLNHLDQVDRQLERDPFPAPELRIQRRPGTLFEYKYDDFSLVNYDSHPAIKAPVAV